METIIDSLIQSHKLFENAHKEIAALTMTDETIARIMFETELQITKQLEQLLTKAGFDTQNLPEKTHIIYNLMESLCHELTFHQHDGLDYASMRQIVTDTIVFILGKPNNS